MVYSFIQKNSSGDIREAVFASFLRNWHFGRLVDGSELFVQLGGLAFVCWTYQHVACVA